MSKSPYIIALTTFATKKKAEEISKTLVKKGLAACVNIINGIDSIYKWEGKIVSEKEILVLIKTISSNQEKLKKFIKNHHEYKNPELLFVSVEGGLENYLEWLGKEVVSTQDTCVDCGVELDFNNRGDYPFRDRCSKCYRFENR